MSTTPKYEFEEDEAPRPERKKFIPGLEPLPPAEPAAGTPVADAPLPPSAVPVSPVPAPQPAPAATPAEVNDPDLKPGSRKDLWSCPHCGTGNRPDRTTCRSCGKAPSDPRERAWWQKPVPLAAIAAVVIIAVVVWVLTRPDLSLKTPGKTRLDRGASTTQERELAGKTFTPKGRIAICGRVLLARPLAGADGVTTVVLLLGRAATSDVDAADPQFNGEIVDNLPAKSAVVHLITSEKPDLAKGAWLSVVGDYGQLAEGAQLLRNAEIGYTVAVEQLKQ
jgi:hypothetical protein